jgi:hypothetical protein
MLKRKVVRTPGHKLDTLLFENKSGILVQASFDYSEPSLAVQVTEAAWAEAGYGGPLSGLSAEQRQTLYAAILSGIRVVDYKGKRRLEVHLERAPAEDCGPSEPGDYASASKKPGSPSAT